MSRGLGQQQRNVLDALRRLERERGPGWRSPADVVAELAEARPSAPNPAERFEAGQLAQCREMLARGHREYAGFIATIEARIAGRAASRRVSQAPNLRRPEPRGGEDANPSRVLVSLARRGLVERVARPGPGAMVRLLRNVEVFARVREGGPGRR